MATKILTILSLLALNWRLGSTEETPRYYLGTITHKMFKCYYNDPGSCKRFNTNTVPIKSLAASGEFLYAGLGGGALWRCPLEYANSCVVMNELGTSINALAVASDYVYAGTDKGVIWKCPPNDFHTNQKGQYHSCSEYYKSAHEVKALAVNDRSLFVALYNGEILKCDFHIKDSCSAIDVAPESKINALAISGSYIFVGFESGMMWRCNYNDKRSCARFNMADSAIYSMDILGDFMTAGLSSGDILKCSIENPDSCKTFVKHPEKAISIFGTYRTTNMNPYFIGENEFCTWQDRSKCIPPVAYYNIQQRAPFELRVTNGKLYDSTGDLFNTKNADISHSGNKAIFVMDPRGRIYASSKHPIYLIHDSSFLAGNPVAAAGELEVVDGVIQGITTCSGHYSPSLQLTKQVITSLHSMGYVGNLTVVDCKESNLVLDSYFNKIED